jgi:hypothetical protein
MLQLNKHIKRRVNHLLNRLMKARETAPAQPAGERPLAGTKPDGTC